MSKDTPGRLVLVLSCAKIPFESFQTREEWQYVFLIASLVHYGGVVFYGRTLALQCFVTHL